jgi:hypothetical protein
VRRSILAERDSNLRDLATLRFRSAAFDRSATSLPEKIAASRLDPEPTALRQMLVG